MPNEEGVHTLLRGWCCASAEEAFPKAFGKAGVGGGDNSMAFACKTLALSLN